jgi:hypothetical protein
MSPWRIPDGQLDRSHTYQNENDAAEYVKAFESSSGEERMMAAALMCANPATPENLIRRQLTNDTIPPRVGYDRSIMGIDEVLGTPSVPVVHSIFDFAADEAALQSTSRPSLSSW